MSLRRLAFKRVSRWQRRASKFLPYFAHLDERTIITKDGDVMTIYKVDGIEFETAEVIDVKATVDRMNTMLRSISSGNVAIYQHTIQKKIPLHPISTFPTKALQELDEKYIKSLNESDLRGNELYLTVIYRPEPSTGLRILSRASRRTRKEIQQQQQESVRQLSNIRRQLENTLKDYGLRVLEAKADGSDSEPLQFLNYLACGTWQPVQIPDGPLNEYLGDAYIHPGRESIAVVSPTKTRFCQIVEFKDYAARVPPGALDALLYLPDMVITQSFTMMSDVEGRAALKRQRDHFITAENATEEQIRKFDDDIQRLDDGEYCVGGYHFSCAVYGDTAEEMRHNVGVVMDAIQAQGFIAKLATLQSDGAWYAQFPGNYHFRPRVADLTSRQLARLMALHGFGRGKSFGNPWGEYLTMLRRPSGVPYAFNFHDTSRNSGDLARANARVIAPTGMGKSALVQFLIDQMQKYDKGPGTFTSVIFDKDYSSRVATLARGGKYFEIENGKPTKLNPFQDEPTPHNISFLCDLVMWLVRSDGKDITAMDQGRITKAVHTMMTMMPKETRCLSLLLQSIPEGEDRNNSITRRLAPWCRDDGMGNVGEKAWVLDNPVDEFDIDGVSNVGIDGTQFLNKESVRTPITMVLLHKVQGLMDGRRLPIFFEEGASWLDDPIFSKFAGDGMERIRKKNGFIVFISPSISAILKSSVASQLTQNVETEIYLPNHKAEAEEYMHAMGLNYQEFSIVRNLDKESRMFLVKHGTESVVAQLDLSDFEDQLAIYSGSAQSNNAASMAIAEYGSNPEDWLPEYHRLRKVI